MHINQIKQFYFRIPIILKLLLAIFIIMFSFGVIIHLLEPDQFPSFFDGVWWAFQTGATVGYGDYVPISFPGKVAGILLILTGGGLLAFYLTSLSASTVKHEQDFASGKLTFKGHGHLIIIGWNERTRQLIKLSLENRPDLPIILIDSTLRNFPYQQYPIHFIHGDPTEDETLHKANINQAAKVLITANISSKERQSDNATIISTVAIRGNNKEIPIIAEILSRIQIENALRAGATTIIRSNDFMSALFFHELAHFKTATPFEDIIQILSMQQFSHTTLSDALENKSFLTASTICSEKRHLLLGIIREKKYQLNPPADFVLKKGDILVTLTAWGD